MAQNRVDLLLFARDQASAAIRNLRSAINNLTQGIDNMLGQWKAALAGWLAFRSSIGKAVELADLAAKANDASKAFTLLAQKGGIDATKLLNDMRAAAKGTVADVDLMIKANQAALLGGTDMLQQMPKLIEISRASAQATGQSVDFLFDSIVLGIGRQSKLILDNLGIIVNVDKANQEYAETLGKEVNQLTDAEKKQAFMNAVLKAGNENIKTLGGNIELATDKAARLTAEQKNLAVAMGKELLPIVNQAREYLIGLGRETLSIISYFSEEQRAQRKVDDLLRQKIASLQKEREIQQQLNGVREATGTGLRNQAVQEANLTSKLAEQKAKTAELTGELKKLLDVQKARNAAEKAQAESQAAAVSPKMIQMQNEAILEDALRQRQLDLTQQQQILIAEMQTADGERRLELAQQIADMEVKIEEDRLRRIEERTAKNAAFDKKVNQEKIRDSERAAQERARSFMRWEDFILRNAEAFGKRGKNIAKALQIKETLMQTYAAAVAGYKSMVGIPVVGPILAPIAAAAATAFGVARVNQIRQLEHGGIIPGSASGTIVIAGEKNKSEAIVPLESSEGPGFGTTFNFYGPVLDHDKLIEIVDSGLSERLRRRRSVFADRLNTGN